jgi:hypothetical protein
MGEDATNRRSISCGLGRAQPGRRLLHFVASKKCLCRRASARSRSIPLDLPLDETQ